MGKKSKEEKAEAKNALAEANTKAKIKGKNLWKEFKVFITRGNILDMAVGVIIGGAFSAIVTAFTNILLSVCTWGVPGGLKGLVTVLPAANAAQAGMDPVNGLDQAFAAGDLQELATGLATRTYGATDATPAIIEAEKNVILSKYTLHGTTYFYNASAIIDWGTFINAIISFLIVALTLFTIVKVVKAITAKRLAFEAKVREDYLERHPEERPAPVVPGAPVPTEMDVLVQIRDELRKQNEAKEAPKK